VLLWYPHCLSCFVHISSPCWFNSSDYNQQVRKYMRSQAIVSPRYFAEQTGAQALCHLTLLAARTNRWLRFSVFSHVTFGSLRDRPTYWRLRGIPGHIIRLHWIYRYENTRFHNTTHNNKVPYIHRRINKCIWLILFNHTFNLVLLHVSVVYCHLQGTLVGTLYLYAAIRCR
jgi:hypothetical protein